jgi:hypothetical protein
MMIIMKKKKVLIIVMITMAIINTKEFLLSIHLIQQDWIHIEKISLHFLCNLAKMT